MSFETIATTGILYGVSVGTGDPDLITVKGLTLLQNAGVIAFPAGIGDRAGVAETIIRDRLEGGSGHGVFRAPPQADREILKLSFPYTRDETIQEKARDEAAETVWRYLARGEDVVFACEGDVSFYSTFGRLAAALQKKHPEVRVRAIPGVCSPLAAASDLGIPLTTGDERLAIVPAIYHVDELESVLAWADVVVLMKFSSVYPKIREFLRQKGLLRESRIVERATYSDRKIYDDLENHPNLELSYFSIWIVPVHRVEE
jgi:precorrin-2/cobalt-factor-2 C20-methyltransferase